MENHYSNQHWWKGQQITPSPNRQSGIVIVWRSGKPSGQVSCLIFLVSCWYVHQYIMMQEDTAKYRGKWMPLGKREVLEARGSVHVIFEVGGWTLVWRWCWLSWLSLWLQRTPGGFGEQRAVSCVASQGQTFKGKDQLSTEAVYVKVFQRRVLFIFLQITVLDSYHIFPNSVQRH